MGARSDRSHDAEEVIGSDGSVRRGGARHRSRRPDGGDHRPRGRRERGRVREGRSGRRHDGVVGWPGVDPEQPAHGRGRRRRQPGARRSRTSCRCRATCSSAASSRPTSTPGRRWSSCSRRRRPVQFYAVPGMPDYHPEFPGGSPEGGRTLECPIYPFDELGEWADRVTPSPYFADPHITMSETPLGKAVPEPPSPEELERRQVRNERGCGQALAGRLLRGLPGPRHRAAHVVRRTRADPRRRRRRRRRRRHARRSDRGASATKGVVLASGGFEWNERAAPGVPARSDDPPGVDRDEHRRRAADGDEGRSDALQHARGVVDPRR